MKIITVCAVSFVLASASFAQGTPASQSKEVQQETKTTTGNKTAKISTDTVYGKVESYDLGKSIKVTVPGKIITTKSFDLDDKNTTVNVVPTVKTGGWVSVVETIDNILLPPVTPYLGYCKVFHSPVETQQILHPLPSY